MAWAFCAFAGWSAKPGQPTMGMPADKDLRAPMVNNCHVYEVHWGTPKNVMIHHHVPFDRQVWQWDIKIVPGTDGNTLFSCEKFVAFGISKIGISYDINLAIEQTCCLESPTWNNPQGHLGLSCVDMRRPVFNFVTRKAWPGPSYSVSFQYRESLGQMGVWATKYRDLHMNNYGGFQTKKVMRLWRRDHRYLVFTVKKSWNKRSLITLIPFSTDDLIGIDQSPFYPKQSVGKEHLWSFLKIPSIGLTILLGTAINMGVHSDSGSKNHTVYIYIYIYIY